MGLREWLGGEDDDEARMKRGCTAMIVAVVGFLASAYYSWQEFKYLLWGDTAEAQIIETYESADVGRRGRGTPQLVVVYEFTDASLGKSRRESYRLPIDTRFDSDRLNVQYVPGSEDVSRPVGQTNTASVVIFFLCLAGIVGFWIAMHRMANEEPTRRLRRPGR